jgi:hypothetical protein
MTCVHVWRYSNDHFRWCGACGACQYWLRRLGRSMGFWLTVGSVPVAPKPGESEPFAAKLARRGRRPARRKVAQ